MNYRAGEDYKRANLTKFEKNSKVGLEKLADFANYGQAQDGDQVIVIEEGDDRQKVKDVFRKLKAGQDRLKNQRRDLDVAVRKYNRAAGKEEDGPAPIDVQAEMKKLSDLAGYFEGVADMKQSIGEWELQAGNVANVDVQPKIDEIIQMRQRLLDAAGGDSKEDEKEEEKKDEEEEEEEEKKDDDQGEAKKVDKPKSVDRGGEAPLADVKKKMAEAKKKREEARKPGKARKAQFAALNFTGASGSKTGLKATTAKGLVDEFDEALEREQLDKLTRKQAMRRLKKFAEEKEALANELKAKLEELKEAEASFGSRVRASLQEEINLRRKRYSGISELWYFMQKYLLGSDPRVTATWSGYPTLFFSEKRNTLVDTTASTSAEQYRWVGDRKGAKKGVTVYSGFGLKRPSDMGEELKVNVVRRNWEELRKMRGREKKKEKQKLQEKIKAAKKERERERRR